MNSNNENIRTKIRNTIHEIDSDAEVILFGSRARGDEKTDSDWDILVLTNYPSNLDIEQKFRDKVYDVELETGQALSIFVYSKDDWNTKQKISPFYENVNTEGITL